MFGGRKAAKPQSRIDSLIGAGTRIEGDVQFTGGMRIDGEVCGKVAAAAGTPATLVVSEQARVEGEIRVSHLVVNGTVVGPVHAAEFLELQAKARISGDVHYNRIEMHLGAVVDGRLVHVPAEEARPVELKLASSQ
jgi:cytoskeletal protein CcmA (bactofilin family)